MSSNSTNSTTVVSSNTTNDTTAITSTTNSTTDLLTLTLNHSHHQFKNSATAFLAITLVLFTAYSAAKFIRNKKTNFGLDVSSIPNT